METAAKAMVSIRPMVIISLYKGRIRISKGTIMVAMTRKNRKTQKKPWA